MLTVQSKTQEKQVPRIAVQGVATQQRAQDAQFEAKGKAIQEQLEAKEIEELRRLQTLGANRR